jgi:UDP-N-acetylmuramate-alanine ligase
VAGAIQASEVHAACSREDAVAWLRSEVRPGDVVLTLGAGDGDKVGEWLLAALEEAKDGENRE